MKLVLNDGEDVIPARDARRLLNSIIDKIMFDKAEKEYEKYRAMQEQNYISSIMNFIINI